MQKTLSQGRKAFAIISAGILTAIGSGLVVFFASLFSDVTQLKAQAVHYQEDKSLMEKRFDKMDQQFNNINKMIGDIHYFLIERKKR